MTISQYLAKYSENIVTSPLLNRLDQPFRHVLVIPACNENTSFIDRLFSTKTPHNFLLILVINQNQKSSSTSYKKNLRLFDHIIQHFNLTDHCPSQNLYYFSTKKTFLPKKNSVLLVDRFSFGWTLDEKQGVGLARKLGSDIAVFLINKKQIKSEWIHSSDADTVFPENYFFDKTETNIAARITNFQHNVFDDDVGISTLLYEISLRYYFHGLRRSQSPFAFFTIGSTLCFHHRHYAEVRGFPKRNAGEDFYLLNKLSKTGTVFFDQTIDVNIEARFSERVPFGTGPATQKIALLENPVREYCYYHPKIFTCLHRTLDAFPSLFKNRLAWQKLDNCIVETLDNMKFSQAIEHAYNNSRNIENFVRHLHQWFDAFRTLKFIHALRDNYFESISLEETLKEGCVSGLWTETLLTGINTSQLGFNDLCHINRSLKSQM